jgi:hypothetical protein
MRYMIRLVLSISWAALQHIIRWGNALILEKVETRD